MKTEKRILTNTVALTTGKCIGDLCIFFFLIYFARAFGAPILGKYSFAMAVGGLLAILISLGLNTVMIREVSPDKRLEPKFIGNFLIIQGFLALLVWALIFIIAKLLAVDAEAKGILIIIGTYHILSRLTFLFQARFSIYEELHYSALLTVFNKLIILILGISSILLSKDPLLILCAYPIGALSTFVLSVFISVRRYGWPSLEFDFVFVTRSLTGALPFFILIVLIEVYDRIGIILLLIFCGEEATGIYSAPDRLLATMVASLAMFGTATFPVMSRLRIQSERKFFQLYEGSVRLMFVIVLPVATLIFLLSPEIILLTFGKDFEPSIHVLKILSFSLLFIGLNHVFVGFLIANNKHRKVVQFQIFILTGYVAMCMVLIPNLGFVGLAYAKLASTFLLSAIAFWFVTREIYSVSIIRSIWASILSCVVAGLVFELMGDVEVWIVAFSTFFVLMSSLFLLGGVQRSDIVYLKRMFD